MNLQYLSTVAVAVTIGVFGTVTHAQEQGSFYLKAFGGASMLRDTDVTGDVEGTASFDRGPVVGAAFGYDYADSPFRSEFEYAYRSGGVSSLVEGASGDFASTSFLINGYYELEGYSALTPYLGAGIGYVTEIDFDISGGPAPGGYSERGSFAWQAMAGASYAITDRIEISGELRYFDAGKRTLSGSGGRITASYATLEALVGVSLRF